MSLPTIDFRQIREHNASQREGFEELAYQLIPRLDDIGDRQVIRHGAPDGGIEARVEFEDGSIRAWQAKYFFAFGDPQIQQMKDSLESALDSWPTLTRYTFVFPSDPRRASPSAGRARRRGLTTRSPGGSQLRRRRDGNSSSPTSAGPGSARS